MPLNHDTRKLYVEFVGQHTAGKTTVIRDIVLNGFLNPATAIYPQKIKRSQAHFYYTLPYFILKNIFNLFFIFKLFLVHAKWNWTNYHAAARHMWKMVILHSYYNNYKFDIWMKDDLLHLLPRIEFRESTNVSEVFKNFFNRFSNLYDGIVYVDLSYEEMRRRFERRFAGRSLRRRNNREIVYQRAYDQNKILKQVLLENNVVPVLVINGQSQLTANSLDVTRFIKDLLREKS